MGVARFWHNPKVWDLRQGLKVELAALDAKGVDYAIFDDPDILLPELVYEGRIVAGADNIRDFLKKDV